MRLLNAIFRTPNRTIAVLAVLVIGLDQLTKRLVINFIPAEQDGLVVVNNFFKLVHWWNTGAAWSMFTGNNLALAMVAIAALVVLVFSRHHFNARAPLGQIAFGLIFGGIVGNLIDRLVVHHVVDFLYFYIVTRGGKEVGFPAFNIADSAICVGVGLIFLMTWKPERTRPATTAPAEDAGRQNP
jgi:signal peptidase II